MGFSKPDEIPPVFDKILKRLEEKQKENGIVEKKEFELMLIKLRLSREDVKRVEEYLKKIGLIVRIPRGHKKSDGFICLAEVSEKNNTD